MMRHHVVLLSLLVTSCIARATQQQQQQPLLPNPAAYLNSHHTSTTGAGDDYFHFSHEIRRVAVIGAGPAGLQAAAALLEEGFEVRLFERADQPGGNWYYQDQVPVAASFP